jgi:hypothetical protein
MDPIRTVARQDSAGEARRVRAQPIRRVLQMLMLHNWSLRIQTGSQLQRLHNHEPVEEPRHDADLLANDAVSAGCRISTRLRESEQDVA